MGTFVKYLIYILLIIAAYFILQGIWNGDLTKDSTESDIVVEVTDGANNAPQGAVKDTK